MEALNQIRNCLVRFRKVCPARWEQLVPTSTPRVRMCGACDREVFFCETDTEALEHAKAGRCIAKPMPDLSGLPNRPLVLGEPEVPEPPPTLKSSVYGWTMPRRLPRPSLCATSSMPHACAPSAATLARTG